MDTRLTRTAQRLQCLVLAFLLLAPVRAEPPAPPAGPAVDPHRFTHEFGTVAVGEPATHTFRVRNSGDVPLELGPARVPPGLGITGVPARLAPGDALEITASVDTASLGGPQQLRAEIPTNMDGRSPLVLAVAIDVRPFLRAHPGYARYITVQKAREGTIAQTLGSVDGALFRILAVDSPTPHLQVTFAEAVQAERRPDWKGSQWRVETTLSRNAPVGPLAGTVVVHTDHPRQKRLRIPLSGFVRPVFAVTPPRAALGDVAGDTPPRRLFVKNFAEETITLTGVEADTGAIRARIEPNEPGRTWWLWLEPAPDAPPGPFDGLVRLRTAHPEVPEITVPVSGRIVPGGTHAP